MALSKLRKNRLLAGLTQQVVAAKIKVSQPTYQRWESGTVAIPDAKIKALAKLLKVRTVDLVEKSEEFDYLGIDKEVPADRAYYGEAAFHFIGNAQPLLMPISEAERDRILSAINFEEEFFSCSSLDNWTVVVRMASISDFYISSDACDEYGPEAERYARHLGLCADQEYWEIIEHSEFPDWLEGIPESRIKEVLGKH